MAYIGRDTDKISNVEVLDNITFDGSSSYTLQKGGSNFTPSSANTILLSIDGVVQAGNFTVSGSTIDFGTAVAGTSTCDFILHYGVGLITTPSDGSVTEAKIGTGAVTSAKLASGAVPNQSAFKNIIINGDMSIAQRGTSFTSLAGVSQYNLDRWETIGVNVGSGRYQIDQSTDTPTGFNYSQKISCTTAEASQDVNNQLYLEQQIEGLNSSYLNYYVASPDTVTLSFWVKSNLTGSYSVALKLSDNGSAIDAGATRIYPTTYSISSANTWEKKTVTITLDSATTETKVVNNGFAVATQFWLGAGTSRDGETTNAWKNNANAAATSDNLNLLGSTSNEWYITGVQLEAGTSASDFEFLPYDVNLKRCQRYYYLHASGASDQIGNGSFYSNVDSRCHVFFPTTMRSFPSIVSSNNTNDFRYLANGSSYYSSSVETPGGTSEATSATIHSLSFSSSPTGGQAFMLVTGNSTSSLAFNSEL